MAYSELIKNYSKIREYMRDFYIYGFHSRMDFKSKSARSYDDEKRRIDSWLHEYMTFQIADDKKSSYLSIDSRNCGNNPLYKSWKTKSFTDGDITLHFILFDILTEDEEALSLAQIMENIDDYLSTFPSPKTFDESTVRKKLKEYVDEGLIEVTKNGKSVKYSRKKSSYEANGDVLNYFSEVSPCGVIGSYILDKYDNMNNHFSMKHHYITTAIDSEILYELFENIRLRKSIQIEIFNRRKDDTITSEVVPLKIKISSQNGRQFLMAYSPLSRRITSFRVDKIISVKACNVVEDYDKYRKDLDRISDKIWGVSTGNGNERKLERVEFVVRYSDDEQFIRKRLEREKRRSGKIEYIDDNHIRFTADLYDSFEIVPWIRSFICRITELNFSNKKVEKIFFDDLYKMKNMYDL